MNMKIFLMNDEHTFDFVIEKERVSVGRASHNDFCVPHHELSRDHFVLYVEDEEYFIQDQGSKNGVFIDGKRIEPYKKFPINIKSQIVIARVFKLAFYRRPGHTDLGLTGAIEVESQEENLTRMKK